MLRRSPQCRGSAPYIHQSVTVCMIPIKQNVNIFKADEVSHVQGMISKGQFCCMCALNASTANNPFSAISTMPVLLDDLDSQLLVHQIVLGKKDVEYHIICCCHRTDSTRLQ